MYNPSMYYTNPVMQNTQQRLQMMEAQYPQFASNPNMLYNQQPSNQQMLKGRPVSNEEEANAAMIDFDGSLFVFPDKAHGKIYTKQLGLDGNIIFLKYTLDNAAAPSKEVTPVASSEDYVTKSELSKSIEDMKSYVTQQLDQLTRSTENIGHIN